MRSKLSAEGLVQQGVSEGVEGSDFGGVIKTQLRKFGCLRVSQVIDFYEKSIFQESMGWELIKTQSRNLCLKSQ